MIVVKIELWSAVDHTISNRGTLLLDNIKVHGNGSKCDYRARMYKKSNKDLKTQLATEKPIREGLVLEHRRHAEPIQNLVAKALKELGYG